MTKSTSKSKNVDSNPDIDPAIMPHRVEPEPQQATQYKSTQYKSHSGSPAPSASSIDRSAVYTPPTGHGKHPQEQGSPSQQYAYEMPHGYGGYIYAYAPPPPRHGERYDTHQHPHAHHYTHPAAGFPIQHPWYALYALPSVPPQHAIAPIGVIQVVHTDDAGTKLSARVRRRCFNCCTTDTTTWRRSNLSPGKVLCNKCGLFERTHSSPRPEQLPHKRGPTPTFQQSHYAPPPAQPTSNSAAAQLTHPSSASQRNGRASADTNGNINRASRSPRLPGVDSWAPPANGEKRGSISPRARDERSERRSEDA
ncbi:hypothetical protein FB451DRAFT_1380129 [Mycena latifolia]|nr:hypothetical protein FB451DRAFT_1380129 [Mycena latifolia]